MDYAIVHQPILITREKYVGEGPTKEIDDTSITAETKYSVDFIKLVKRLVLSLHYKGSNSLYSNNLVMSQNIAIQCKWL